MNAADVLILPGQQQVTAIPLLTTPTSPTHSSRPHLTPLALWYIHPGGGRTLLPTVLKCASNSAIHHIVCWCAEDICTCIMYVYLYTHIYMYTRAHKRREGVRACNFDLFGNTQSPVCTKNRVLVVGEAFLRLRYTYTPT